MAVIKKRADELKPGDTLAKNGHVVKSVTPGTGDTVEVRMENGAEFYAGAASAFDVFVPHLTPAQQHADALLALVESLPATPEITAVLDKIQPPAMPSTDELCAALCALQETYGTEDEAAARQHADEVIARMKRAAAAQKGE